MSRAAPNAARWLGLAAAPTFAAMGLVTSFQEAEAGAALCAVTPAGSPLGGMAVMYLLMSAFHLGPWLRLVSDGPGSPH